MTLTRTTLCIDVFYDADSTTPARIAAGFDALFEDAPPSAVGDHFEHLDFRTLQAAVTADRIVFGVRCAGALLAEDDFDREDVERAVQRALDAGHVFGDDRAYYETLTYENAPEPLREIVDDLWVATSMRNGTHIANAAQMFALVLERFDATTDTDVAGLPYPLTWLDARAAWGDATLVVPAVDAQGRALALRFARA